MSQWIALQNNSDGKGPLASYFEGEQLGTGKADTFTANMCVIVFVLMLIQGYLQR
jgi:hypothetical protein